MTEANRPYLLLASLILALAGRAMAQVWPWLDAVGWVVFAVGMVGMGWFGRRGWEERR